MPSSTMKHKASLITLIACLLVFRATAELPFNDNLAGDELDAARRGEVVIRNISSYKKISLETENSVAIECLQELKNLNPKYFVEVLQVREQKPDDRIVEKMFKVLFNVEEYTAIPYYSVTHDATAPLYSYCKVLSQQRITDGAANIETSLFTVDMTMPPFQLYTAQISIETDGDRWLLYRSENLTDVVCMGFVRVKTGSLRSVIFVSPHEGQWIIYGIGAAKAPKIPLLTRRIETAFIGRVKAFCDYAVGVLDE